MSGRNEEIQANWERAESSLDAARVLLMAGHADDAVSRAYYAAFYAAAAALLREGLDFGKHTGVIAAVHRVFVKEGRLERRYGRSLNWLYELRSVGDYGETEHVPHDRAEDAIETAQQFVRELKKLRGMAGYRLGLVWATPTRKGISGVDRARRNQPGLPHFTCAAGRFRADGQWPGPGR